MKILNIFRLGCFRFMKTTHRVLRRARFPFCQGFGHECFKLGKKQRQNTAYVDDKMNWVIMCDGCAQQNDDHWSEMWDSYNRSRL